MKWDEIMSLLVNGVKNISPVNKAKRGRYPLTPVTCALIALSHFKRSDEIVLKSFFILQTKYLENISKHVKIGIEVMSLSFAYTMSKDHVLECSSLCSTSCSFLYFLLYFLMRQIVHQNLCRFESYFWKKLAPQCTLSGKWKSSFRNHSGRLGWGWGEVGGRSVSLQHNAFGSCCILICYIFNSVPILHHFE